jgi:hypothetical protein
MEEHGWQHQALESRKDNKLIHKIFYSFLFGSIIKAEFPIEFIHFGFSFHEAPKSFISSSEINSSKWSIIISFLHSGSDFITNFFQSLAFTSNPFLVNLFFSTNFESPSLSNNTSFTFKLILRSQNALSCVIHTILKQKSTELISFWHSICEQFYYNPDLAHMFALNQFTLNNLIILSDLLHFALFF